MSPVDQVEVTEKVPASSQALAQGLENFALAVIADHKAGGAGIAGDVTAAVASLVPIMGKFSAIPGEAAGDPLGLAEAFMIAGMNLARKLNGSLPSA